MRERQKLLLCYFLFCGRFNCGGMWGGGMGTEGLIYVWMFLGLKLRHQSNFSPVIEQPEA